MGFFDRIRKGKLFFGKKDPSVVVKFFFRGQEYILEEFDIAFHQETDAKNHVAGEMSGLAKVQERHLARQSSRSFPLRFFWTG